MVEFDCGPKRTTCDEELGTGSDVDWETIAKQELGVTLHHHARTVDRRLTALIAALRDEQPIDPEAIHGFRTEVEQLENAVTSKLTQINELERASEPEQLERMGHELLQQFHRLARDTRRGQSLDDTQIEEVEHALAEAEALLRESRGHADTDEGTDGAQNEGTPPSNGSTENEGACER